MACPMTHARCCDALVECVAVNGHDRHAGTCGCGNRFAWWVEVNAGPQVELLKPPAGQAALL